MKFSKIMKSMGLHQGDTGFSLTELLIVVAILPVILGAAYLVFNTMSGNYSSISAQSEATSEAQRAMDVMVREIRQAQEVTDGGGAIATATPTSCSFYIDLDQDSVPERVTYYVDGTDLYRCQAEASSPVYPYGYVDGPAQRVVNLTTTSAVVFTYYDKNDPDHADASPNVATICAVGVHLTASRPATNGQVAVDFTTRVKIRALFNSLS
ncbi:MAG TPA: prepilin-type N-terminal cleavage/methylation domain-containing protein [Coriobacteriia bacterium]